MKPPIFTKPGFSKPNLYKPLPSMQKAEDPLKGVNLSKNIEESPKQELTAVQEAFRASAKRESKRFEDATDTGYYNVLVGESRAQIDEYLEAIGFKGKGDLYLDVRELAEAQGIKLTRSDKFGGSKAKIDKDFAELAR